VVVVAPPGESRPPPLSDAEWRLNVNAGAATTTTNAAAAAAADADADAAAASQSKSLISRMPTAGRAIHPYDLAGSSRCKGVSWDTSSNKWKAMSQRKHLGLHNTEEAAARACSKYLEAGAYTRPLFSST